MTKQNNAMKTSILSVSSSSNNDDSVFSLPFLPLSHAVEFHVISAPFPSMSSSDSALSEAMTGIATGYHILSLSHLLLYFSLIHIDTTLTQSNVPFYLILVE